MNYSNARGENESFAAYKQRLKWLKKYVKARLRGLTFHDSARLGTYRRTKV